MSDKNKWIDSGNPKDKRLSVRVPDWMFIDIRKKGTKDKTMSDVVRQTIAIGLLYMEDGP